MGLALAVAENVMGGRSPSLRRVSMVQPPPEEHKGIGGVFKRKKTQDPVMVFSFSAEEVVGSGPGPEEDTNSLATGSLATGSLSPGPALPDPGWPPASHHRCHQSSPQVSA
jgi:hypothetical protein